MDVDVVWLRGHGRFVEAQQKCYYRTFIGRINSFFIILTVRHISFDLRIKRRSIVDMQAGMTGLYA